MFDISIIVVNWNTQEFLRGCLQSIATETRCRYQIIVVDNASADGSVEMVARDFPEAVLIANDRNRGFAAANNQGISVANGRYVLLLNPDTLVLDGAIDTMVRWMDARPEIGCAGCQVLESEDTIQETCFADMTPIGILVGELGLVKLLPHCPPVRVHTYADWDRKSERNVDVVSGMFILVPRTVIDVVGVLDEAFFVYAEEADWCRRIRAAGYRCVFTPAARIIHVDGGGKSTKLISERMHVQMHKSKMIYIRKYYGWRGYIATKMAFVASALIKLSWLKLNFVLTGSKNAQHRARLALAGLRFHLIGR